MRKLASLSFRTLARVSLLLVLAASPIVSNARIADTEIACLEAEYFAETREEAVRGLFKMVRSEKKEELIARLVACDDPAAIKWAHGVLEAHDSNVPYGHPDLEARVAAALIARDRGESGMKVRNELGLSTQLSTPTMYEWELRLNAVENAKSYPMLKLSPEIEEQWGDGLRSEYSEERKAELKDLIQLASESGLHATGLKPSDFSFLIHVWLHQTPDTALLETLWSEDAKWGYSVDFARRRLFKYCESSLDESVREWVVGKLREIRDSQEEEIASLAGSTITYLEKQALSFEVRDFMMETILRRPGNYVNSLPRLIYALRYEMPHSPGNEYTQEAILRAEEHFRELADMAADSATAYPASAWLIEEEP